MNKKIFPYLYIMLAVTFFSACSRDLGNYNYHAVNEIMIDSLKAGGHHTNRIYTVSYGDTLKLNPTITGTLSGTDLSNLSFEWTIDGQNLAATNNITYVANKKYGKLLGMFTVLDNTTNIKTSYSFFVDVVNSYKLGYYLLSKKENGDAVLYCQSTIKAEPIFREVIIPTLTPLGKNPVSLSSSRKYGASSSDYFNQIVMGINDAKYPVSVLDSREFTPTLLYNNSSYIGSEGINFKPLSLSMSPVLSDLVIYAVNQDNKLYSLWKGAISLPICSTDPLNYEAAANGFANPYSYIQVTASFYDKKNKQIRFMGRDLLNPLSYTFTRMFTGVKNINLTDGQEYLFGAEASGIDSSYFVYLTKKDDKLYSYKAGYIPGTSYQPAELVKIAEKTMPDLDKLAGIRYDISGRFWYVSIGRTIYRASVLGLDLQPYLTLPASDNGSISKFIIDKGRILISTYNTSTRKSSVYIYDSANLTLINESHGLEQVVDLVVGI